MLCNEVLQESNHEQRIAIRAAVDRLRQGLEQRPIGRPYAEPPGQILADCCFTQQCQRQFLTQPVQLQLLLDRTQGMSLHDHVHRTKRAKHE